MSLRQLVDADCGGANPLMQLGGQFTRDVAHKDEGLARAQFERALRPDEQMINEFLGQVAAPPQSFQMNTLLQEMREIEQQQNINGPAQAARVIDEVRAAQWAKEFGNAPPPRLINMQPQQQQMQHVHEFFDEAGPSSSSMSMMRPPMPQPYLAICPPAPMGYMGQQQLMGGMQTDAFFDEAEQGAVGGGLQSELPKVLFNKQALRFIYHFVFIALVSSRRRLD